MGISTRPTTQEIKNGQNVWIENTLYPYTIMDSSVFFIFLLAYFEKQVFIFFNINIMNKFVRLFIIVLSLFTVLPWTQAQLVKVIVTPDHTDWKYKAKETATFSIQVMEHNNLLKDVVIDYELGPEKFPNVSKQNVVLKDGTTSLKASLKEPGFLRCKVTAKVNGKNYTGLATAAYEPEKIQPTVTNPEDFDQFWNNAIAQAQTIPLDGKITLMPEQCTSTVNVYHISYQNEKWGSRMYGILSMPKKEGKYPAILRVPGAGIRPYNGDTYNASKGIITLEIGIHGVPVNLPNEVYNNLSAGALNNYPALNKNDRETHYYKRVFLGCVRAVDFIYSLPEFDGENVCVTGGSQGGALSIITAGLDKRIKFLAAFYPAMCDHTGYLNNRAGGWPHYYASSKPSPNEVETLAYFDVVNFARRVTAPGWYSWGYNDEVCPPTSMHSAYNPITAPKELHIYEDTGHWTYSEQNEAVTNWICKHWDK